MHKLDHSLNIALCERPFHDELIGRFFVVPNRFDLILIDKDLLDAVSKGLIVAKWDHRAGILWHRRRQK